MDNRMELLDFGDSILFEILSNVVAADHWLLRMVCARFRLVIVESRHRREKFRTLDVVLSRAISEGGLATVRYLIKRPSGEWGGAVSMSASKGYMDVVKCIVESHRGYDDVMSISAALSGGHVDIAEFLWDRKKQKIDRYAAEILLVAAAKSASLLAVEWIVSKFAKFEVSLILSKDFAMTRMMFNACIAGDLKCLEYVCTLTTQEVVHDAMRRHNAMRSHSTVLLTHDVDCLLFLHGKFGYAPTSDAVRSAVITNNHRVLEYLSRDFLKEMLQVPLHMSPDMHAFLKSKGHQITPTVDLNVHVSSALTNYQMKNLMQLQSDPREWISSLSPTTLEGLLGINRLQELMCDFFRGHRLKFEIKNVTRKQTFTALREMGGRCGWSIFLYSVVNVNDIDYVRHVWAAVDVNDRATFLSRVANNGSLLDWLPNDVDVLKFLLGIGVSLNGGRMLVSSRHTYTLELVEFAMVEMMETPLSIMFKATSYGHLDIIDHVAPLCTLDELHLVLRVRNDDDVVSFLRKTILQRTHFMWRWYVKFFMFGGGDSVPTP